MELFDFEAVAEDRPRSSLTYEERLEAAARRRLEGNEHYQDGRFGEALGRCAALNRPPVDAHAGVSCRPGP